MSAYRRSGRQPREMELIVQARSGKNLGDVLTDIFLDVDGSLVVQSYEVNQLVNDQPTYRKLTTVRFPAADAGRLSVAQLTLHDPVLLADEDD